MISGAAGTAVCQQTDGESEPGEAEASFSGNNLRGRWKVNDIIGYDNKVTFSVVVGP